ncbi:MAG TPA: hypothetical protein VEB86_14635 [Chryseosolibacter sp.]|nr:hypothetical protein [Chryseosolibacter sp.]
MTTRIADNTVKGAAYLLLFLVLIIVQVTTAQAQSPIKKTYMGFTGNFGTRTFGLNSDIDRLHNCIVNQSGGQLGVIYGNNIVRYRIGLVGYYSSGRNVPGSIDLYVNNASVNFYPLALIQSSLSRVQPYINGGASYDRLKFYGHYLSEDAQAANYSTTRAPYLGAIKQINGAIGTGLEIRLIENHTFVHLFSEVRYGFQISDLNKNSQFGNTTSSSQVRFNFGIAFGCRK